MKNIAEFPLNTDTLPRYSRWELDYLIIYECGKLIYEDATLELDYDNNTGTFTFYANPYELVALMESSLCFRLDKTYEQHASTMEGSYYGRFKFALTLYDMQSFLLDTHHLPNNYNK